VPPNSSDLPVLDWPLSPAWLSGGAPDAACARMLSGDDLQALLAATGRNMGDFTFRAGEQAYGVYLAPWLPGVDYTGLIASSGQAARLMGLPSHRELSRRARRREAKEVQDAEAKHTHKDRAVGRCGPLAGWLYPRPRRSGPAHADGRHP
jgi:hypothetical protein